MHRDEEKKFEHVVKGVGEIVHNHVVKWYEQWLEGAGSDAEVERRLEIMLEGVVIGEVLWFGVLGRAGKVFNADFVSADFVTSTLFLPLYIIPGISAVLSPPLSLANRLLLPRTYLSVTAAWYVSRGRAPLPISQFFDATSLCLSVPLPPQRKSTVPESDRVPALWPGEALGAGGNPWLRILEDTMVYPDTHLCKVQRALAYWAGKYGSRPAGYYSSAEGGLAGVERLDGTLFVRLASLVEEQMGWAAEGAELHLWDHIGLFEGREPRAGIIE